MTEVDGGFVLTAPEALLENFYEEAVGFSWDTLKELYEYACPERKFEDVSKHVASLENEAFGTEGVEILQVGRAIYIFGVVWIDILESLVEFGDPSRIEFYGALYGGYGDAYLFALDADARYSENYSTEGGFEEYQAMFDRWQTKLPKKIKKLKHSIFKPK